MIVSITFLFQTHRCIHINVYICLFFLKFHSIYDNIDKITLTYPFIFSIFIGFGHFIAIRLAKDGFIVFAGVLDINGKGANKLKDRKLPNLHLIQLDVTKSVEIQDAVDHVQKIGEG